MAHGAWIFPRSQLQEIPGYTQASYALTRF